MQARAPDEGPSGVRSSASETCGQLIPQDVQTNQRYDPILLRAVVGKYNIHNTKSLVAAYNKTTDKEERDVLLGWLRKYQERREDCLTQKAVLEYAELVNIAPRSISEEGLIKDLISDLCSCIPEGEFLPPSFATVLYRALVHVDPSVYGGVAELAVVAKKLLGSLSARPKLERENFSVHKGTFLALQQTLFLFLKSNQSEIDEEEKRELRQTIAAKERALEPSCNYYPVKFRFQVLRQAVERLEARDTSRIAEVFLITGGFCGSAHVLHSLLMLACIEICPEAVQRAFRKARVAVEDMGVLKRPWFNSFHNLMAAKLEAAKDETKLGIFRSVCSTTIENQRRMKNREELKALRFGIIDALGMLAIEGSSERTRREATIRLSNLAAQQAIGEGWIDDDDILIALLDVIHEVHKTGQYNETTKEALLAVHRYCGGFARGAMIAWLDGKTMEEKLRAGSSPAIQPERKELFIKTRKDVGYTPLTGELFRQAYLRDDFATVVSLLDEGSSRDVKDMKYHVVMYDEIIGERDTRSRDRPKGVIQRAEDVKGESSYRGRDQAQEHCEKTRVAKSILLEDLFKRRSLESGDPESEVRRVLLYGNPGSGKTCIARVIAYNWALGEMAQDLDAVYVVPVRVLSSAEHSGHKWTRLEEAVSEICFSESQQHNVDYKVLVAQVKRDLDDPSTLLMLDGLDEANDHAMELLSTIWERSCKVLFLSRPYNTRDVEIRVDVLVECLGFNDEQLRDYIESELPEEEARRLIRFIEDSDALWEMAHVPATANVLCSLSKKHGTAIEERGKGASLFQLCNEITNFTWKRFKEKPTARKIQKMELFQNLERIAFESLRNGLVLIDETFVTQHTASRNAARKLKESGLLLPVLEDQAYRFPQLTFQKYFAGRHIAKNLQRKGLDGKKVVAFIREEKYNEKHAVTLSFGMHAFAERRGKDALQEMLSIVDEEPVEVFGIQHFFLKMRVLNATLEETHEDDLKELLQDKRATKLAESARLLLERTIDDAEIRRIIVQEFQQLSRVLKKFPQVLDKTIEEVRKTLACVHNLTHRELNKVADVLKLTNHCVKQSSTIIKSVLEKVDEPVSSCMTKECIRRLNSIAKQLPHHAGKFLPKLAEKCGDGDRAVRRDAMMALSSMIAAAPHHAGEFLPKLAEKCGDGDRAVRRDAMMALSSVIAAAPHHAGEFLSTLAEKCGDGDSAVRQASMTALSCVVAVEPQHAVKVLPALAEGFGDGNSALREAAMSAIGSVVSAAPQHADKVMPKLDEKCDDVDWAVRRDAMMALSSVVSAAPQHAAEFLPMLAKGCTDGDWHVREAAMMAISSIVAAAPRHGVEFQPILAEGCDDKNWRVRQATTTAIGSVVTAAPQYTGKFLSPLAERCTDEHWHVRHEAMTAIGCIVAAAPRHVGKSLTTLVEGCTDGDPSVREASMTAISSVVAVEPQHVGEFLPTLTKRCGDEDSAVRRAAISAIGTIVRAAPQYAEDFQSTLDKGCSDGDWHVREASLSAIGSVVTAASQQAAKFLSTLTNGCGDGDPSVRRAAMTAISSVIAAAPQHAGEFLPKLATGCGDEDPSVRRAAMTAINSVIAAAPQHAGEFLSTLAMWSGDGDWHVREAAIVALSSVIAAAPCHAGEFLPKLAEGCSDGYPSVRRAAMTAIGSVITAVPQHTGKVLPALAEGFGDGDSAIREVAMSAIGSVVAAAPQHADKVLPAMAKWCGDGDSALREATTSAIGCIVAAAPQYAGEFLPMLAKRCGDEDPSVRRAALTAISSVLAAAPHHAGEFLPTLAKGCGDGYPSVRHAAITVISRVVAAAPQYSGEFQSTLAKGCGDGDSVVREAAMSAIASVVASAPQQAGEFLSILARGCGDVKWHVRHAAMSAISSTVAAAPRHVREFLSTLVRACDIGNHAERQAAMAAIGSVVAVEPHYAGEFLPTLVKGCVDGYPSVRRAAISAIGSVVAAAPQHARQFQPTLGKGCGDGDSAVREAAMTAIGSVVAAVPQHADKFLPTLANGCRDGFPSVRRAAISAIGSVVADTSHILNELLQLLETGYKDKDFFVRQNAIENVGKAFKERQDLASQLLPILESGCNDQDFFVRQSAIEAVCKAIIVAPNFAGGLLKLLDEECIDEVYFVRWSAMEAVGKAVEATSHLTDRSLSILEQGSSDKDFFVRLKAIETAGLAVEAAPQFAGELMPILERGSEDEHSDVRANALKALEAVPQFVCQLVSMLERGCVDEDNDVRLNALRATGTVVKTALHLSSKLLPMLQTRCNDEQSFPIRRSVGTMANESRLNWITPLSSITALKNKLLLIFVQNSFTLDPTTEEEKVSLVLHALSSHEIGNWEGEALNKHLEQLTEDFEEKFPGLLENLVMHE